MFNFELLQHALFRIHNEYIQRAASSRYNDINHPHIMTEEQIYECLANLARELELAFRNAIVEEP